MGHDVAKALVVLASAYTLGCDRAAQRLYQEQQEARRTIMTSTTWNGTHLEQLDLLAAISRHCACQVGFDGVCVAVCPPHRMLVEDQRALDGLLFARRLARCLAPGVADPPGCCIGADSRPHPAGRGEARATVSEGT